MKAKNIILLVASLVIFFNTIAGVLLTSYSAVSCLSFDLSLLFTAIFCYILFAQNLDDGLKIGMSSFFVLSGIIRGVCMFLMGDTVEDNIALLVALAILTIEIVCMCVVFYLNKK